MKKCLIGGTMMIAVLSAVCGLNGAKADNLSFSAEVQNSLKLSLSSDVVVLNLNPEVSPFSTSSITATASTNNEAGYKLTVTSSGTSLSRTEALADNAVPTIPTLDTLAGGYDQNSFTVNHWGYNKGSGNYLPFSSPIELGSSDGPVNAEQNTMVFAAKVDFMQPAGTYDITLAFAVTANVVTVVEPMQSQTAASLAELLPNVGDTVTMEDSRDGEQYLIGKTADNKYWMLDNLRLGGSESILLTPQDTNISSNFTLPADNGGTSYDTPNIIADSKNDLVTTFDGERDAKNGVYYNLCAMSASVHCEENYPLTDGEWEGEVTLYHLQADICPAGWHIPGEEDFFRIIYQVYPATVYDGYIYDYIDAIDAYDFHGGGGFINYLWGSDYYDGVGVKSLQVAKWVWPDRTHYDLQIGGSDSNIRGDENWSPSSAFQQVRCVFGPSNHSDEPEEQAWINNMMDMNNCEVDPTWNPEECGWEDPEFDEPEDPEP